jgi:WD40 repeat protein
MPIYRRIYHGHTAGVSSLAWSPDGIHIVSGSGDTTVQVWNVNTGESVVTYRGHQGMVSAVAWSPDGAFIASGGVDKTIQVWEATTGEPICIYRGHTAWVRRGLTWSPDSTTIASGAWDSTVQVWEARSGNTRLTYRGHRGIVYAVAWSLDGKYIASGGGEPDKTVQVWEAVTGEHVLTYHGHRKSVHGVMWLPNGGLIASFGPRSEARLWNAATGQDIVRYDHLVGEEPVAWSRDGAYLIAVDAGSIVMWDAATQKRLLAHAFEVDPAHFTQVKSLAWSPDGTSIAVGGSDTTVKVWEVATMEKVEEEEDWERYLSG